MGKQTQLMLCYKNYCSHFWIIDYTTTTTIKNSQKLPKTTILVITTEEAEAPQIITSISSQLYQSEKWPDQEKVPTSQNSATYRPPIKIKQINYQPEIFGPWALGPKG